MARDFDALTECLDCGLIQGFPQAGDGCLVTCQRCDAVLAQVRSSSIHLSLVCSVTGLALMAFALFRPAASLTLTQTGRFTETSLFQGVSLLEEKGTWELGLAVAFTLFLMPVLKLLSVAIMSVFALRGWAPRWAKTFFATMRELGEWAMVDVFLLGAMIALIRLKAWGTVWYGPALIALGGVALCTLAIDALADPHAFWKRVDRPRKNGTADDPGQDASPTDPSAPLVGCHHCGRVVQGPDGTRCPRCEQRIEHRKSNSIPRTWAFLLAGGVLLLPANVLPVMAVTKMGRGGFDTILSGTIELAEHGLWGLATIVFVASIVVPVLKLASLAVLLVMTQRGSDASLITRTKTYRLVTVIGRWSMIDIFATMTLVAISRFGWLGNVMPGNGASAFCAVVFLTMIASDMFEPRLMWDAAGKNGPVPTPSPGTTPQPAPVPVTQREVLP